MKVKAISVKELRVGHQLHWSGTFRRLDKIKTSRDRLYTVLVFHNQLSTILDESDIVLVLDED